MEKIATEWLYPSSLEEAVYIQRQLAEYVIVEDKFSLLELMIGGVDVSNNLRDPASMVYASAVILKKDDLLIEEKAAVAQQQLFPYTTGFLSFREIPALVAALKELKKLPEVILVDGHGISHPRGLGIASHLGVLLDIPTIGVAKSILVGHPAGSLGEAKGETIPLVWKGKEIAACVRTKARCNPIIVSVGHRISLKSAIEIVLQCCSRYRLPEPTRQAHLAANECRKYYAEAHSKSFKKN